MSSLKKAERADKPKKNKMPEREAIKNSTTLRKLCRLWVLNACDTRTGTCKSLRISESALSKLQKLLETILPQEYLDRPYGKAWAIRYTMFDAGQNPLLRIFCSKSIGRANIGMLLQYLRIIGSFDKPVLLKDIDNKAGCFDYDFDVRTTNSYLKKLSSVGYVLKQKKKYSLSPDIFRDIDEPILQKLLLAVDFMINIVSPATCGFFLFTTLNQYMESFGERPGFRFPFTFLHNHIAPALDDDVLWSLLSAMSEKRLVSFTYEPDKKIEAIAPLRIITEGLHGRRYLFGRGQDEKLFLFRLDKINKIKHEHPHGLNEYEANYICDIHLRHGLYGTSGRRAALKRIHLSISAQNDALINVLKTIFPDMSENRQEDGSSIICFDVNDPTELKPWLRRHLGVIKVIPDESRVFYEEWQHEMQEWRQMYGIVP